LGAVPIALIEVVVAAPDEGEHPLRAPLQDDDRWVSDEVYAGRSLVFPTEVTQLRIEIPVLPDYGDVIVPEAIATTARADDTAGSPSWAMKVRTCSTDRSPVPVFNLNLPKADQFLIEIPVKDAVAP
jgi:hypothetical protein